ncbi:MAG: hypothetical protein OEX21_08080 [Betaproteobacteria bacterium]|nr:hypothetical protein [Betaproteobacteria bacterium]
MQTRQDLERRIRELEAELARARAVQYRGVRYRSAAELGGLPLLSVATGPDPDRGERRGHARGVVAIGDIASGILAVGGVARGLFAFGGLALGVVTFGGASIGALAAVGGLAIGGFAFGGGAVGWTAIGGGAAGTYACGGAAAGAHVVSASRRDPEALAHFASFNLDGICDAGRQARRAG